MSPFHHHGSSTKKITKVSSLSTLLLSIGRTVSPPLSCSPPINSQTALKLHMWVDSHTHTTQIDTRKQERHTPMKSFKALVVEKTQMLSESGDSFQIRSFPHVLSFSVCVGVCDCACVLVLSQTRLKTGDYRSQRPVETKQSYHENTKVCSLAKIQKMTQQVCMCTHETTSITQMIWV